jgi:DNA-damage-inducible protein D
MSNTRTARYGINGLLSDEQIRKTELAGRTWYIATDVISALADTRDPELYWNELKAREPHLAALAESAEIEGQPRDIIDLDGLLRVIQSVPSPRAERLKWWLAESARQRLEEAANPELAVLRTRKLYESRGYSRKWIDKRLRAIGARHELTGEWYKRGARESEQFRALTNDLMAAAFGMDVESYRRYKGLSGSPENLRDHMTDMELALTALGETVAVALHRDHNSATYEELTADARDAGQIAAFTRGEIEKRLSRSVTSPYNHGNVRRRRITDRGSVEETQQSRFDEQPQRRESAA